MYADKEEKSSNTLSTKDQDTEERYSEEKKEAIRKDAERMDKMRAYDLAHPEENERIAKELLDQQIKRQEEIAQQEAQKAEAKRAEEASYPKRTPEEYRAEARAREKAIIQSQVNAVQSTYYYKLQKDYIAKVRLQYPEIKQYFSDFDHNMRMQGFKIGHKPFVQALEKGFAGIKWGIMIHEEEPASAPTQGVLVETSTNQVTPTNTQITAGVGAHAKNLKADVLVIQRALLRLGLLSESDFANETTAVNNTPTPSVEQEKIQQTIAAIRRFQEEVLHWNKSDGNIAGPDSKTLLKMRSEGMDCDHVQKKLAEYPAIKAKRAAAAKAEEQQKKATEAARQRAEEEADRIKCIQAEPATDEHIEKNFITQYEDLDALAAVLVEYVIHNPSIVQKVLQKNDNEELAVKLLNLLTDAQIASTHKELLQTLLNSLTHWYDEIYNEFKTEKARLYKALDPKKSPTPITQPPEYETTTDISADKRLLKKTFNHNLSGSVGANNADNYKDDVKMVARKLKEKGYELSNDNLQNGLSDKKLITAIEDFQKDQFGKNKSDGIISPGKGTIKALFPESGSFDSGLEKIYANRNKLNTILAKGFTSKLTGDVGADYTNKDKSVNKAENNKADVIRVAKALQASKHNVPEDSLIKGISSKEFIDVIKAFQTSKGIGADGNITIGGKTDKELSNYKQYTFGMIEKISATEYSNETSAEEYYKKTQALEEALGIKEDSDYAKVLQLAEKAARETKYFDKLTADVSAQFILPSEEANADGAQLSGVFQSRMERFHKFLVMAGLYQGDMKVNDGVRSPKRAHGFAVQYYILTGKSAATVKANLIMMYNSEDGYLVGDFVEDHHGHKWAKKSHFILDANNEAVGIHYDKVQAYVKTLSMGRDNKADTAAQGYKEEPLFWPLPKPDRLSIHVSGGAMDINRHNFINQKDAMVDLIAHKFGVVRAGSWGETWHFELSDLAVSGEEADYAKNKKR
ncbi:hypothetical protein N7E81_15290 [Reichenbachiella carrageenanivorans]|uniref:Peptidoglycan binding domain-containing protein n=1 Tax=Reichenbachiella carrageenanivorans TaxID=2979869 RepID=A0ABY6D0X9_9BACT|nr:hypothetical protein [Reichenbachiella carrageenanivorans]UXX78723.1 hypothetical protein N7E81_15290 [Reichenbachiella carrageenanivorans]